MVNVNHTVSLKSIDSHEVCSDFMIGQDQVVYISEVEGKLYMFLCSHPSL